jgi:hypothetical protein
MVNATTPHVSLSAQAHAWAILDPKTCGSSIQALFFPWMKETFVKLKP